MSRFPRFALVIGLAMLIMAAGLTGDPASDRAEAKRVLAMAGSGPETPLKMEMVTRGLAIYLDFASFVIDQVKQVGVQATLKQVAITCRETGPWSFANSARTRTVASPRCRRTVSQRSQTSPARIS